MAGASRLQQVVEASNYGCYGIEWMHADGKLSVGDVFNPEWRVESAKANGYKKLFTDASSRFSFQVGDGAIGKVFQDKKTIFAEDIQVLSQPAVANSILGGIPFARTEIAKEFGIRSAAFVPSATGVIEIGSLQKYDSLSDFMDAALVEAIEKGSAIPAGALAGGDSIPAEGQPACPRAQRLQKLVEGSNGASFAIEWVVQDDGILTFGSFFNPKWRVQEVKAKGIKDLYTSKSAGYNFPPSEGFVGKVFASQKAAFVPDLQHISESDVLNSLTGPAVDFLRADLAKEFGIISTIFIPVPTGVIEIGATRKVAQWSELLPSDVASKEGLAVEGL
jgi:hypothetical protein